MTSTDEAVDLGQEARPPVVVVRPLGQEEQPAHFQPVTGIDPLVNRNPPDRFELLLDDPIGLRPGRKSQAHQADCQEIAHVWPFSPEDIQPW